MMNDKRVEMGNIKKDIFKEGDCELCGLFYTMRSKMMANDCICNSCKKTNIISDSREEEKVACS